MTELDWSDLLMTKGPLWLVFAVFVWALIEVIRVARNKLPGAIDEHRSLVSTLKDNEVKRTANDERTSRALETLSQNSVEHGRTCAETREICKRTETAVSGLGCIHRTGGQP